jgi:hypothetical protein
MSESSQDHLRIAGQKSKMVFIDDEFVKAIQD